MLLIGMDFLLSSRAAKALCSEAVPSRGELFILRSFQQLPGFTSFRLLVHAKNLQSRFKKKHKTLEVAT